MQWLLQCQVWTGICVAHNAVCLFRPAKTNWCMGFMKFNIVLAGVTQLDNCDVKEAL